MDRRAPIDLELTSARPQLLIVYRRRRMGYWYAGNCAE